MMLLGIAIVFAMAWIGAGWMRSADAGAQPEAGVQKRHRRGMWIALSLAVAATLAHCATGIDLSRARDEGELRPALTMWAMVGAWGVLPWALLLVVLQRTQAFPWFQWGLFAALVGIAVMLFAQVRLNPPTPPSGGWEFLIVPALQLGLVACLCLLGGAIVRLASRAG